jgi:hypothetical protein
MRNIKLGQNIGRIFHRRPIGFAAHDDSDRRFRIGWWWTACGHFQPVGVSDFDTSARRVVAGFSSHEPRPPILSAERNTERVAFGEALRRSKLNV